MEKTEHASEEVEHAAAHEVTSYWPAFLVVGVVLMVMGFVGLIIGALTFIGMLVAILGFAAFFLGWIGSDIARDRIVHSEEFFKPPKRNDTRFLTGVFLITEVMLFSGAFAAFLFSKFSSPIWPPAGSFELDVSSTFINTLILVSSGVTLHVASMMLSRNNQKGFNGFLGISIVLGAIFLGGQFSEYLIILDQWAPSNITFGSVFFMLTGLHGVHVMTGLGFIVVILVRSLLGVRVSSVVAARLTTDGGTPTTSIQEAGYTKFPRFTRHKKEAFEACSLFWHFVDIVWIFLFFVVYLNVPTL